MPRGLNLNTKRNILPETLPFDRSGLTYASTHACKANTVHGGVDESPSLSWIWHHSWPLRIGIQRVLPLTELATNRSCSSSRHACTLCSNKHKSNSNYRELPERQRQEISRDDREGCSSPNETPGRASRKRVRPLRTASRRGKDAV